MCDRAERAILPTADELESVLYEASERSVYAVENQLKQGFLTAKEGERIGLGGSYVYEGGSVNAVREITSLCIRVPHEVYGCAEEIYRACLSDKLRSVLLLSPPGGGKTTILRELSRVVCEKMRVNTLICDERGELSAGDTGVTSDVVRFCDKCTAFTAGIRALRPDLIVTDELLPSDYEAVKRAIDGGICVFASAHLTCVEDVPQKLFERYVLLKGVGQVGEIICG